MELKKGVRLLKGFTNTLVVGEYVVDPGLPAERAAEVLQAAGPAPKVLLTHFHADHLTAVPPGAEVYAPWGEELLVANVRARLFITYGVYVDIKVYKGGDIKVSGVVKDGERVGPFEVVSLPGHTFGHVGYYVEEVLYAGDALYGEDMLKKYGAPYLMDVDAFLASLDKIIALEPEVLVMSHGPVVNSRKRAAELIETNRRHVERAVEVVAKLLPGDLTKLAVGALKEMGVERRWENILLAMATVRAILSKLSSEGRVYLDEEGTWKSNP